MYEFIHRILDVFRKENRNPNIRGTLVKHTDDIYVVKDIRLDPTFLANCSSRSELYIVSSTSKTYEGNVILVPSCTF